jgi:hypothetical protein
VCPPFLLWVKRVGFVMSAVCPVYPKEQTFPDPVGTSHLCHKLTWRPDGVAASSHQRCFDWRKKGL